MSDAGRLETFGIAPTSAAKLERIFASAPDIDRVWIYGSRARGDHRESSDIDLAVDAPRMSPADFSALGGRLEALGLIYRVDLLRLQDVKDEGFRERIGRDRKVFWEPRAGSAQAAEPRHH